MFFKVDQPTPDGGSSPRNDLRSSALAFKPTERGYEYTFQQHDGTDLFQWFRRSSVFWYPCGPVLALSAARGEAE